MTSQSTKAGCRHTGNWPISRRKALTHPEPIQTLVPLSPRNLTLLIGYLQYQKAAAPYGIWTRIGSQGQETIRPYR